MLMPSLFRENLLDDFFEMPAWKGYGVNCKGQSLMNTDIKEREDGFDILMNLPGFKKEDIKAELKDGYLTVHAERKESHDEKNKKGTYIRRERYSGSCSRSFYVGDAVTQEDIKAKFNDGVLSLDIPKKEAKPVEEQRHLISIEG